MLEKQLFSLGTLRVLVIDEVDFIFNSSKQASSLRKILTYSSCNNHQTVFSSASIPQHNRFLNEVVQQKWTKRDVIHIHVNPVEPMPSRLYHRFIVCDKKRKLQTLLSLIQSDAPESGIIFVSEQSEKSKKTGNAPSTSLVIHFLKDIISWKASIGIVMKLTKHAGTAIRPHLSDLVCCMLESLSSLEDQGLNYVELHAATVGIKSEKLESFRISIAKGSPMWETLDSCIKVVDAESLDTSIPRLAHSVRPSVGLNTRVGVANFITLLLESVGVDIKPYANMLVRFFFPLSKKKKYCFKTRLCRETNVIGGYHAVIIPVVFLSRFEDDTNKSQATQKKQFRHYPSLLWKLQD
ncbi:hypothetical protein RYX36_003273 [Vicia faba]